MSKAWMLSAVVTTGVAATALAQDSSAARYPATPSMSESTLARQLAKEIRAVSVLELRALEHPTADDYKLTGFMLDLAAGCAEEAVEDLRLRSQAAFEAGDMETVDRVGRRLLKADPKDTVTQLRLISSKIAMLQTTEARLAAIDRLLGEQGSKLDPSVRSRLALDGALLARERGDEVGYVSRLKSAAKFDATHREAALAVYEHVVSASGGDSVGEAEALVNWMYADPLNPSVHLRLRDLLLRVGAVKEAKRFHQSRLNILNRMELQLGEPDRALSDSEDYAFEWLTEGPASTVSRLEAQLRQARDEASRRLSRIEPSMRGQERKPEDFRLSFDFEVLRMVAALASNDRRTVESSIDDLTAEVAETLRAREASSSAVAQDEEAAMAYASAMMCLRAHVVRLLSGVESARIAEEIASFESMKGVKPQHVALVKAWRAFRDGNIADCERELSLTDPDPLGALLAAELALGRGDTAKALALWRDIYTESPLSSLGLLSRSRMIAVDEAVAMPGEAGRQIASIAATVPQWFDSMASDLRLFQILQVTARKESVRATDSAMFDVTLKNVSSIPLGLGRGGPLSSNLVFGPTLDTNIGPLFSARQELVEFAGRLRLMPGEQVAMAVEPERGVTGYLAETWCRYPVRVRWRVIQVFAAEEMQLRSPGPGCSDVSTKTIVKQALGEAALPDEDLARSISSASESQLQSLLFAARAAFAPLPRGQLNPPNAQALASALAAKYPTLSPAGRAMVLCIIPPTAKVAELSALDAALTEESDPALVCLAVILRVMNPEHELIARCEASDRADVREVGRIVKSRLIAGRAVYATRGVDAALVNPEAPR